jgi:hypothetical protein
LGETINTIKKNKEVGFEVLRAVSMKMAVFKNKQALFKASKEVGLEVNTKKISTCSCLITRLQDKIIIQSD